MLNLLFYLFAGVGLWWVVGYLAATVSMLLTEDRADWLQTALLNLFYAVCGPIVIFWSIRDFFRHRR